jgi:hypothetical protein
MGSWDSSVGIVTGYGLDGLGSYPIRGKVFLFSMMSKPALGPTQPLIQWVLGAIAPGSKVVVAGSFHLELWSRVVELYLHSPICPHGIVLY